MCCGNWRGKEQKEIERILAELSAQAAGLPRTDAGTSFQRALTEPSTAIFARAKLSYQMKAMRARNVTDDGKLSLVAGTPSADRSSKAAVPISVRLG